MPLYYINNCIFAGDYFVWREDHNITFMYDMIIYYCYL
jgi:hypothetical protein